MVYSHRIGLAQRRLAVLIIRRCERTVRNGDSDGNTIVLQHPVIAILNFSELNGLL